MIHIESGETERELIKFVHSWFDLLAQGKDVEACALLDKVNCYGIKWTPVSIKLLINEVFSPDTNFGLEHPEGFWFSMVKETDGKYQADVMQFNNGTGYSVEHDVPLNGVWSDLTAQFEFIGEYPSFVVILHDLHVL